MKAIITTILLSFSVLAIGQNAWQDAVKLNEFFEFDPARFRAEVDNSVDVNESAVMAIVAKYCPETVVQVGDEMKVNTTLCFEGNPFISLRQYAQQGFANNFPISMKSEDTAGSGGFGRGGGGMSGGNFITNLADGLAIFLVKRTKEELNATFFEGLQKAMTKEPAYQALFPATFDLLYVIGEEVYNYNAYIESLREGFLKDLEVLPMNVRQFSLDHQFVKKPDLQILLEDLLGTSQMVFDAEHPIDILNFLSKSAALQDSVRWKNIPNLDTRKAMQDIAMSLRALDMMVASMTNSDGSWVSTEEVSTQMRDISHTYLYLGLLWQQGKGLQFSNGVDFRLSLGKLAAMTQAPISLRNYLVSMAQTGKLLDSSFKKLIGNAEVDSILNDDYVRFAGLLFEFLEQTRSLRQQVILPDWKIENGKPLEIEIPIVTLPNTDILEHRIFTILHQLFDLEFNVRQEHYTMAVANLTRLLEEVLNQEDFKFKKQFLRHANFMANVAEARNSKEIAAAIELFALPPGSSRMKKQSPVSVSLNSYGGIAYGWENDLDEAVNDAIEDKNVLSTSAPLGIGLNFGLGKAGSISFYTQVIDVGAIFAYRFSNQTSQIPELKFQNIVAPGFYGIYGFGNNIPVSVGVGAQLGPNLRKIDETVGLDIETTNAWRFGFILSVDIPITHFYTK